MRQINNIKKRAVVRTTKRIRRGCFVVLIGMRPIVGVSKELGRIKNGFSKHHEGFALFHSKVDKFNVVDATSFKRDIIDELANACAKKV